MKKLIATGNGHWLYQTGFTTVYEGTGLETTFVSGYAEDANGNQTEIRNIMSALDRDGWTIIDTPDLPAEKAREKRFSSRSEAGRYAAQVRWGNRQQEEGSARTIASNGVPLEPTWDVNEAILTGRPYAPFLEENYPPEVLKSLDDLSLYLEGYTSNSGDGAAQRYFASHLDPAKYSPEVLEMLGAPKPTLFGDPQMDEKYAISSPSKYYNSLLSGDVGALASNMALEAARKRIARKLIYSYGDEDAKQVVETFRASPNKQLTINVGELTLGKIDETGMVLNQFGTANSGGLLNLNVRATHEAISYGVHPATKADVRPIYGTFHPIGVRHTSADGVGQYGSVQLVLKPEVHDRATFTMHDSLGMVRHASPVNGKITMGQEFPSMRQGKDAPANPVNRVGRMKRGLSAEYAETQIHGGGVKISDIGSIVWSRGSRSTRKTPPPEVQAFAKKHGLKVVVAEFAKAQEPWGVINPDGAPVQKSFDAIVAELTDVILKAKSFDDVEKGRPRKFNSRSEAGRYAAQMRWGNRTGDGPKPLAPHMQAMKDEADAIRAELDDIVKNMDMENLQRSSPKTRPRTWTDDKGAVQIDTLSEEMVPSPRLADAHDRVLVLGDKMIDESLARVDAKQAAGDKRNVREIYAESMHEVVSELTPVGGEIKLRGINGGSEKEQESMTGALQSMASVMPSSWVASSGDAALDMSISMSNTNPFFRPSPERRGYKTGVDLIAFPPPSQIAQDFKTSTLQDIVGHEYTHMVENRKPAVKALSIAFITHRTTGYQIGGNPPLRQRLRTDMREERLGAVSGGMRMEISKDSFSSLYSGRRYDSATKYDPKAAYARTPNNDRKHSSALEVLTTGVEQYLNGNIGGFDSNHMSFVLGTLVST